jgi:hypothetical protein
MQMRDVAFDLRLAATLQERITQARRVEVEMRQNLRNFGGIMGMSSGVSPMSEYKLREIYGYIAQA